jgi:membrane protein involved in colicin uptake
MKTILIRTLAIAMLTASISGFAQTSDVKSESTATKCTTTQRNDSEQMEINQLENNDKANQQEINQIENNDKANQEEKKQVIDREDKQWDKDLMGLHG